MCSHRTDLKPTAGAIADWRNPAPMPAANLDAPKCDVCGTIILKVQNGFRCTNCGNQLDDSGKSILPNLTKAATNLLARFKEIAPKEKCGKCNGTGEREHRSSEAPDMESTYSKCGHCTNGFRNNISPTDQALITALEQALPKTAP